MSLTAGIGTIIDNRFVIVSELGSGGTGTVYEARQAGLNRTVALKVLQAALAGDTQNQVRFEREGRILSTLSHPNIPVFYHFGSWNGSVPYIAMEFLSGSSLRDVLQEQSTLPWQRVLRLAVQACDALSVAHGHGIIHRDIKPNNIMVLENDAVKVVDFGLARILADDGQRLTQTGMLVGSSYYMSPEQCVAGKIDGRSDIYSLACVIYEAIVGAPPLVSDNLIALMHKHVTEEPKMLSAAVPSLDIPPGLDVVLLKGLAKDPVNRQQSMEEFKSELELVLSGQGETIAGGSHAKGRSPRLARRSTQALAGAVVLCALVFSVAYLSNNHTDNRKFFVSTRSNSNWNERLSKALSAQGTVQDTMLKELLSEIRNNAAGGIAAPDICTVYEQLANHLANDGFPQQAEALLQEALPILKRTNHWQSVGKIKNRHGRILLSLNRVEDARKAFMEVVNLKMHINETEVLAAAYQGLAECAQCQIDVDLAESNFLLAMETYRRCGHSADALQCLTLLEIFACTRGDRARFDLYRRNFKDFVCSRGMDVGYSLYVQTISDLTHAGYHRQALDVLRDCKNVCASDCKRHVDMISALEVQILADMKQWAEAEKMCRSVLKTAEIPIIRTCLGSALFAQRKYQEAEKNLLVSLHEQEESNVYWMSTVFSLARLYDDTNKPEAAAEKYRMLAQKSSLPSSQLMHLFDDSAEHLFKDGEAAHGELLMRRAIEVMHIRKDYPHEAFAKLQYCLLANQESNLDLCLAKLGEAIEFYDSPAGRLTVNGPQRGNVYTVMANLLTHKGRYAESEAWFRKSLLADSSVNWTMQNWHFISDACLKQGKLKEAEIAARNCLALAEHNGLGLQAAVWAAQFYLSVGNYREAVATLESFEAVRGKLLLSDPIQADLLCQVEFIRSSILKDTNAPAALDHAQRSLSARIASGKEHFDSQLLVAELLLKCGLNERFSCALSELRQQYPNRAALIDSRLAQAETLGRKERSDTEIGRAKQ